MDLSFLVVQFMSGLASASTLFIAACGLTIVFGVTRVVNFAHGSFYMIGGYLGVTIVPRLLQYASEPWMFFLGVILSACLVGLIGLVMEFILLRRIYKSPELFQLLATFGVVLIVQDLVIKIWGPLDILGPRAPGLRHAVMIFGNRFPAYEIALIIIGPLVLGLLHLLLKKSRFGVLIRAATQDREMVAALGVNQAVLFSATFFLGAFLAGLGGALMIPKVAVNPAMDISIITEAFVVTVIGGMGSVTGAFLAALIIGQLQAFGILIFPKVTLVLVFALMAVVLVVRPWGLLGKPEAMGGHHVMPELPIRRWGRVEQMVAGFVIVLIAMLPMVADDYILKVAIEIGVFALVAFSLNFLMGHGGLHSFGHAAYFGLGAYAAGLMATRLSAPMEVALVASPIVAGLGAALFGYFVVRLSGIYLAMLTLACAQLVYAIAFQWIALTGGDNGVVGVWPSGWAKPRIIYYYLVFTLVIAAIYLLRRALFAPFGYTLRAARDSANRSESIGIDVRGHRLLSFSLAGSAAGLAGGLYAFSKGSIDPTLLGITTSVDALAMVLLGGVQTVVGPLVGAATFVSLHSAIMTKTDLWRAGLGSAIILIVIAFPHGLAGMVERLGLLRSKSGGAS